MANGVTCLSVLSEQLNHNTGHSHSLFFFLSSVTHHCTTYTIGINDQIKTLAKYYDVKYNDSPRYELLKTYAHSVESGRMSPMVHFDLYEDYYQRIQTELVGKQTNNGITITGQSKHFTERVFGTMVDPEKLKDDLQIIRRSGVSIEEIESALFNPIRICPVKIMQNGNRSIKLIGRACAVTINPDTGILIQTNPLKEE